MNQFDFKRRGAETKLVLPGLAQHNHAPTCDPALIKAIARGHAWFEELATGRARSLQDLAKRDGITRRYIRRLVDLASDLPVGSRAAHNPFDAPVGNQPHQGHQQIDRAGDPRIDEGGQDAGEIEHR
jgi:hypothetical protein